MAVTQQKILDKCYGILREIEIDSSSYDPLFFKELINSAYKRLLSGDIIDKFAKRVEDKVIKK